MGGDNRNEGNECKSPSPTPPHPYLDTVTHLKLALAALHVVGVEGPLGRGLGALLLADDVLDVVPHVDGLPRLHHGQGHLFIRVCIGVRVCEYIL